MNEKIGLALEQICKQLEKTSNIKCVKELNIVSMKELNIVYMEELIIGCDIIKEIPIQIQPSEESFDKINLEQFKHIINSNEQINILPLQIVYLLTSCLGKSDYLSRFIFVGIKDLRKWEYLIPGLEFIYATCQDLKKPINISCEDCKTIILEFTNIKKRIDLTLYSYEIQKILYLGLVLSLNNSNDINKFNYNIKVLKNKLENTNSFSRPSLVPSQLTPSRLTPPVRSSAGLSPPGLAPPGLAPPGLAPPGLAPSRPPGLPPPVRSSDKLASQGLATHVSSAAELTLPFDPSREFYQYRVVPPILPFSLLPIEFINNLIMIYYYIFKYYEMKKCPQ